MKKEEIPGSIGDREEKILKLSDDIWEYAETKFEEYKSASRYCELLEAEGFRVTKGIADMETACQTRLPDAPAYIPRRRSCKPDGMARKTLFSTLDNSSGNQPACSGVDRFRKPLFPRGSFLQV